MSTENEAKLAELKDQSEAMGLELQNGFEARRIVIDEIAKVKKAIVADEQKPKLRHGDYGFHPKSEFTGKDTTGRVVLSCDMKMVTAGNGSVHNVNEESNKAYYPDPVLGNIFDDLKAILKPLEKFKIDSDTLEDSVEVHVTADRGGVLLTVKTESSTAFIRIDKGKEFSEFITKLRRMEAGMK